MCQINMLYTLNLCSVICQIHSIETVSYIETKYCPCNFNPLAIIIQVKNFSLLHCLISFLGSMVGKGVGMNGRLLRWFSLYFPSLYLFLLPRTGLGRKEYWEILPGQASLRGTSRIRHWCSQGWALLKSCGPSRRASCVKSKSHQACSLHTAPSAQAQPLPEQTFCSVSRAAGQAQSFCLLAFTDMGLIPVITSQNHDVQVKLPKWLS